MSINEDPIYIVQTIKVKKIPTKLRPLYSLITEEYSKLYSNQEYQIINQNKKILKTNNKRNISSYTIYILLKLKMRYPNILNEIFKLFEFSKEEIDETEQFIENINKTSFFDCKCWINKNGTKLMRGLFYLIDNNKLPLEIVNNLEIKTPDIYGEFASLDIQQYIENFISVSNNYTIKYNDLELELSINTNNCNKVSKNYNLIISRALILGAIHKKNHSLNINIWFTKMKKRLPKDDKLLGPCEINSGSSYINNISLWREEEYQKLILHETIHNYNIDFRLPPSNKSVIFELFNINPNIEIRFFESYTEIIACIVNCILCSYEMGKDYDYCLNLLNIELNFSIFQLSKILVFYGFENIRDFYQKYDGKDRFKQTTSVFSYFFVKLVFLYNLDELIEFIDDNCDGLVFPNNQSKIDNLFDLFIKLTKKNDFMEIIDSTMNKIKYFSLDQDSLRMTVIQT